MPVNTLTDFRIDDGEDWGEGVASGSRDTSPPAGDCLLPQLPVVRI